MDYQEVNPGLIAGVEMQPLGGGMYINSDTITYSSEIPKINWKRTANLSRLVSSIWSV